MDLEDKNGYICKLYEFVFERIQCEDEKTKRRRRRGRREVMKMVKMVMMKKKRDNRDISIYLYRIISRLLPHHHLAPRPTLARDVRGSNHEPQRSAPPALPEFPNLYTKHGDNEGDGVNRLSDWSSRTCSRYSSIGRAEY